jgi:hypothetical protein
VASPFSFGKPPPTSSGRAGKVVIEKAGHGDGTPLQKLKKQRSGHLKNLAENYVDTNSGD